MAARPWGGEWRSGNIRGLLARLITRQIYKLNLFSYNISQKTFLLLTELAVCPEDIQNGNLLKFNNSIYSTWYLQECHIQSTDSLLIIFH